ncbi:RHS repeat-associated core domain-containing protein [Bacillus sp. OV166]|uniref:SpvB/TcaC N-terminal domain-containing protein n=1 Tax=Bacillus sp. OV166 TaxID=1882763 RepID=UPI000A2AC70F|nr:SpvB/TcaC N-terminal domain-containing protein [Bacillus sp. OV166]SMQ78428.1 RHS repeat-associated core domain-containing protein [Bacillus sp. OV166]
MIPDKERQTMDKRSMANEEQSNFKLDIPTIDLPKGGGAIRNIGEKFAANPVTGTGSMTVPIATSPGRSGFGPQLSLTYDSGAGNGPFGMGWNLSLPSIKRKTDKGLPRYQDTLDSDVFILSGTEDLVPILKKNDQDIRIVNGTTYSIRRFCSRIEGLFTRIERWTNTEIPGDTFWRSISKDNSTTWYGRSENSRISDPENPERIYSWLICQSHDDKGNVISYHYKSENAVNIELSHAHEQNRGDNLDPRRSVNRYLKYIRYGNDTPFLPRLEADHTWPEPTRDDNWYFEVVFDYGEHSKDNPSPKETGEWSVRKDPFSSYRSTFEVRTYRLCQRVLMFHHIPDDPEGQKGYDGLVRSTDFTYQYDEESANSGMPVYSKLTGVTQRSYQRTVRGDYLSKPHPPLEFTYSDAIIQTELHELRDGDSLENLPIGIDGAQYQWVDLDGEGLSGVLSKQDGAWFYKRNLSPTNFVVSDNRSHIQAKFAPMECVSPKPMFEASNHVQFLDLSGNGRPDVVEYAGPIPGFYERTMDELWDPFVPFASLPNVNWGDPNLKFIDLDGDGRSDILISEHDVFVWHRSLGEIGFDEAQRTSKTWDEEKGPNIVFADAGQSIFLSDMSGDGMNDIVRIRNNEVCYWPNLGYGCFGVKITMDNAPLFDHCDQFEPNRIRLADIDGTGTTDILYLHRDGVRVYFNRSGNCWSTETTIKQFPPIDSIVNVQALDLLGNGTACLIWSSPLSGDAGLPLRYLDLMGGQKPHLLVRTVNNLGLETRIDYTPSTKFYLFDKKQGKPWITKLPFPVHCVEKVTVKDKWRNTTFTTTYSYHHGYFDGEEREFRGFGRVEQTDIEEYGKFTQGNKNSPYITDDQTLYQPPVKTVSWYHTGACLYHKSTLSHFKDEYFPNWLKREEPVKQLLGSFQENELSEPDFETLGLNPEEWREALRACKGIMLRQEVYELDVDELARGIHKPVKLFSAANHNCHIHRVQPKATNQHAVFLVTESESVTYHYELDIRPNQLTPDPRIVHTLNLSTDEYGNIQQSVTVVYPRLEKYVDNTLRDDAEDLIQKVQSELHISYTETRYTNDVPSPGNSDQDNYRLRLPCEVMTYELTGLDIAQTDGGLTIRYFTLEQLCKYKLSDKYPNIGLQVFPVEEIDYHLLPNRTLPQKRVVEHTRVLFFDSHLDKPLPFGTLNALGLPYQNYKLALTDEILGTVFKDKLNTDVQDALTNKKISGYLTGADLDLYFGTNTGGGYWMCSSLAGYNTDAPQHFYLPERYTDPFDNQTVLTYDSRDLYVHSSMDALLSRTEVTKFDFRVLAPAQMKDANDNLTEVRFDILGMPTAMALMGKGSEADNLNAFDDVLLNPNLESLQEFFINSDYDVEEAKRLLSDASARYVYYFGEMIKDGITIWEQHPACACGIIRERHVTDEPDSPLQSAFEYSDGTGNVVVKKVQAEPELSGGPLRWIGSAKTILNNKGKTVKQYEPYFSLPTVGHRFEDPPETGVATIMYYDAVGRNIRTESPDGSYTRIESSPWHVTRYDPNDTVKEAGNAWYVQKSSLTATAEEQRAALLAAEHADTPSVSVFDCLGREVVAIAHNRVGPVNGLTDEKYVTFTKLDNEGKPLWVQDSRGNRVMQYINPPLPEGVSPFNDPNNINPKGFVPCYDIAGNLLFQHSMDAGDRWMLNDAAGKPMFVWNSRSFITRMSYDGLHRLTGSFVTGADPVHSKREMQFEKLVYGEGQADDKQKNLRGKLYIHFDTAGNLTFDGFDFKGNPLRTLRRLTVDYKATPDWLLLNQPVLETEWFTTTTRYDALNRPIQSISPYSTESNPKRFNITQYKYNEAGRLGSVDLWLGQSGEPQTLLDTSSANEHPVKNIKYNAKGQRLLLQYGNGSETTYSYDSDTFRLKRLRTTRINDGALLQDLDYTYDAVGNITQIQDNAQDRVFHSNQCVQPGAEYRYDALYRLIAASGREHKGNRQQYDWDDVSRFVTTIPNDCQALQNYVETYRYDKVGNIMQMMHHSGRNLEQPGQVIWNRRYQYALESNRLLATSLPGDSENLPEYNATPGYSSKYAYDLHGNITAMPHLPQMNWDFKDQLSATTRMINNGDTNTAKTYYVYDSSGRRVRKITETQTGALSKQRIYLDGFEVYREYSSGTVTLERESLHVMDDKQRVALIETETIKDQSPVTNLQPLVRFQLSNHLGSVNLELDENAAVITYEEYTPYGSTAYCAGRSVAEVSLKRYRYTGKERDEESGLYYHGARYYGPWLGRWMSCDPMCMIDGTNLYGFVHENPVKYNDPTGTQCDPTKASCPELMGNWSYGTPVPDRGSIGHNVQRDHPIQVSLRSEQRQGLYSRTVSAARSEQTVLVETGKGYFHTEVGRLQAEINERVRAGMITSESELIEATREAYRLAGETTGVTVNPQALDRAIISNLATLSERAEQTASELRQSGGPPSTMTGAIIERAFSDPGQPVNPSISVPSSEPPLTVPKTGTTAMTSPAPNAPINEHPPNPVAHEPSSVTAFSGRAARAAEAATSVLKVAGEVLTVYGAVNEANRTAELERRNNRGALNEGLMWIATAAVGVPAGAVDDALAAFATATTGSPAPVMEYWDHYGSGPVQHAAGKIIRGILDWGARNGF